MGPGRKGHLEEQNYLWQMGPSDVNCSGSSGQILTPCSKDNLQVPRCVVLEAWNILRHGSGAQLVNNFSCMMNFLNFGVIGRQRAQMDALEAQKTALTHTEARQ